MINPTIFYQLLTNQDFTSFYANYGALQQKLAQNIIYQNSINFNSIFSYAVSMDFKNFQTQYFNQQMKKQAFDCQMTPKQQTQITHCQVTEKKQKKIQKNLNCQKHENEKLKSIQLNDLSQKSDKQEQKSKAFTSDESSQKQQFDNCSIKENKNNDKKFKKSAKFDKLKELPIVDLIQFAFIKKAPVDQNQIQKKKNSLLARQVANWNQVQKSRRNQKLQLRRIKY